MFRFLVTLVVFFLPMYLFGCETVILISKNSSWKYLDDGTNQGSAWRGLAFDDSGWAAGNAELGYGDGDEATVVSFGPDGSNKYPTTYFRSTFQVSDPSQFTDLSMWLKYDDGAVVYINGTEITRANMPNGNINYQTFASSSSDLAETFAVPNSVLTTGTNVIAVEIHQHSGGSSDISLDFELSAVKSIVPIGSEWKYLDDGSNQGVSWSTIGFDDSSWASGPAELGYGDGPEATVVSFGPDSNDKYPTTYFRKSFNIDDLSSLAFGVTMEILVDDGAVVYLNGNEVFRTNMPSGLVNYLTYANGTATEDVFITQSLSQTFFVQGNNEIAVEIHNRNATSTDISFDLKLCKEEAPQIVRGPYLQMGTEGSMTVKWRTNIPVSSQVSYGTDQTNLNLNVSENNPVINHEMLITGLTPATKYFYEIRGEGAVLQSTSDDHFFVTSPTAGTDGNYRFWVLGDCGTANNNQRAVRDAYRNFNGGDHSNLMLFLGDNAYNNGTDEQYQAAIFENMYEDFMRNTVSFSCPGNHDYHSASGPTQTGPYYEIFSFPKNGEAGGLSTNTEAFYSFDYGNVHIVSLDSHDSDRSVGGPMLTWLENDLANTTQEWIIAIWHHPPYTKGSHDSDTEGQLIQMRENTLPILEAAGVDLVLNGHSHSYERSKFVKGHYGFSPTFDEGEMVVQPGAGKPDIDSAYCKQSDGLFAGDGAVYITAGSSGKISGGSLNHPVMQASLNLLGSVVVDVAGDQLDVKFVTNTGAIEDYFSIKKKTNFDPATDTDNDGYADIEECPTGWPCVDTDDDGQPDIRDEDSDGDSILDVADNCRLGYELMVQVLLEGAYNTQTGLMASEANTIRHILPGQTPTNPLAIPTPPGQPYSAAPWNYAGTEGADFDDTSYPATVIDWVLISLRTDLDKASQVWQAAALLHEDGQVEFIDACLPLSYSGDYNIVVQHRSHVGVMTANPITLASGRLVNDFSAQNTYVSTAFGQKEIVPGTWVMFSGDIDKSDLPSYDINATDRLYWEVENGLFDIYDPADMNFDGDINGVDKILWSNNNGIFSQVPK